MKISKFKFFHGKINSSVVDFYEEFFRRYDNPINQDIRTITRNLNVNRIINVINNSRTANLINNV